MVWCPNSKLDLFHIWVDFGKGDHTHWSGTYCTCIIFRIEILISTLLFFCIMVLWLIYLIAKLPYVLFALWYFCLIADYLCVFCLNVWLMAFFILPSYSFLFFWLFWLFGFDLWHFCHMTDLLTFLPHGIFAVTACTLLKSDLLWLYEFDRLLVLWCVVYNIGTLYTFRSFWLSSKTN